MNITFYEITAQVIPIFIVAVALQTRYKLLGERLAPYTDIFGNEKVLWFMTFVVKFVRFFLYMAFMAEITSLAVVFVGGAPWPVSLLVWPGLIGMIWILASELSASVENLLFRSVLDSVKRETARLEGEAKRLRDNPGPPSVSRD